MFIIYLWKQYYNSLNLKSNYTLNGKDLISFIRKFGSKFGLLRNLFLVVSMAK